MPAALPIDITIYLPSAVIGGIGFLSSAVFNAISGSAAFIPSKNALWAFFLKVFISIFFKFSINFQQSDLLFQQEPQPAL